jgi:hypothetical protein
MCNRTHKPQSKATLRNAKPNQKPRTHSKQAQTVSVEGRARPRIWVWPAARVWTYAPDRHRENITRKILQGKDYRGNRFTKRDRGKYLHAHVPMGRMVLYVPYDWPYVWLDRKIRLFRMECVTTTGASSSLLQQIDATCVHN